MPSASLDMDLMQCCMGVTRRRQTQEQPAFSPSGLGIVALPEGPVKAKPYGWLGDPLRLEI